ncbi:MAG: flagellar hook capping FlgD N-terminal domain-containing protein [Acidimicrobiales bacterium]
MTDYISAVAGATVNPLAVQSTAVTDKYGLVSDTAGSELDREAFLKLLVTQLRYQDPLNPSDPDDFIATTAQFTTIEELQKMSEQTAANALNSSLTTAGSLIGREIGVMDGKGLTMTTTVQRAQVISGEVHLVTADGDFTLDQIVEIA